VKASHSKSSPTLIYEVPPIPQSGQFLPPRTPQTTGTRLCYPCFWISSILKISPGAVKLYIALFVRNGVRPVAYWNLSCRVRSTIDDRSKLHGRNLTKQSRGECS
jgi:hypothetical protein